MNLSQMTRTKRLLISWLQSPSVVILEPRKIKSDTVSTVSPSISHEVICDQILMVSMTKYINLEDSNENS